jgi:putative spermidine/putrescine transport system permease protein
LLAFFLLPAAYIVQASILDPEFTLRHFQSALTTSVYVQVFLRTVQVSLVVALATAVIGYPIAYFINLQPRHRQFVLLFLIFVPMWMSVLIRSYAWIVVLGRDGIINGALISTGLADAPVRMLYTTGAVYLTMVQILLPVQIIACFSAMTEIDMDLVRAARVLGAKPAQALRRVFLPLSLDGAITGSVIVFMLSMGFFITPALIGGRRDVMIANMIDFHVQRLNWGFASALALLLLAASIVIVVFMRWLGSLLVRRMA